MRYSTSVPASFFVLFALTVAAPPHILSLSPTSRVGFKTVYGILAEKATGHPSEFVLLKQAVDIAALRSVLDAPSPPLTVFAPTDAAFLKLARALMYTGSNKQDAFSRVVEFLKFVGKGDPLMPLTSILKYHVVLGKAVTLSDAVAAGTIVTAFMDTTIHVRSDGTLVDKAPAIPDPRLIMGLTDIQASNGIAHAIDGVLLPFPISEAVTAFLSQGVSPTPPPFPTRHPGYNYYSS